MSNIIDSRPITTYLAFLLGLVLVSYTAFKDDIFGLPYAGKGAREYLISMQPKSKKKLSEEKFNQLISAQEALGERILQLEIQQAAKKNLVHLEKVDAYLPVREYKGLKKLYEAAGLDLDSATPVPVNGIDGKQLVDERTDELCFTLPLEKQRFEQANRAYHARTKRELKVNACGRGRGRQVANKTLAVWSCLVSKHASFEGNLERVAQATDKEVLQCHRKTGSSKAKSPVGGILTSRHSYYAGMDIKNHASGKQELKAAGFSCGLAHKYFGIKLGSGDKNHCWLTE